MIDGIMGGEAKAGIGGFAIGIVAMITLNFVGYPPVVNEVKVFQEENLPSVMRVYKPGADKILVEDPKNKEVYIPLNLYLNTIRDEAERGIREAEIKKAVRWYEE